MEGPNVGSEVHAESCSTRVIVLNVAHLRRLLGEYVAHYHHDRTHCGLDKQTPGRRAVQTRATTAATVIGLPRIGGLSHPYDRREAAESAALQYSAPTCTPFGVAMTGAPPLPWVRRWPRALSSSRDSTLAR